ncbi:DUF6218 family protein [Lentzea sp. NPDC051838]|uniref:DUF6218 family protein n=1 Tax=Lentzea sp. NPDC051838 TaxID=3154849 RepID=UPI00342F7BFF
MIGHFVLHHVVAGQEDVVAVWHINAEGDNTGAWIVPAQEAFTEYAAARRLVDLCADRLMIGWAPTFDLVHKLEAIAGTAPRRWTSLTIPDALAEISEIRSLCEKRVPLEWQVDLPDPVPATEEEMHRYVNVSALSDSRLVRWTILRWQETASALRQHVCLKEEFGEPDVLPPHWFRAITEARADHPARRRSGGRA